MSRPAISISMSDIMLIIMGVAMLLLGGLVATIYTGVSSMVASQFRNITQTDVTNYAEQVASYVPMILNMLGLALIISAVAHIIVTLIFVTKGTATTAGIPGA